MAEMNEQIYKRWDSILGDLLAICNTEITQNFGKIEKMVKNQPTIDAFIDRRWSSEYHFLSKLFLIQYNHSPCTYVCDMVHG